MTKSIAGFRSFVRWVAPGGSAKATCEIVPDGKLALVSLVGARGIPLTFFHGLKVTIGGLESTVSESGTVVFYRAELEKVADQPMKVGNRIFEVCK